MNATNMLLKYIEDIHCDVTCNANARLPTVPRLTRAVTDTSPSTDGGLSLAPGVRLTRVTWAGDTHYT